MNLTFTELNEVYDEAKDIYESSLSWKAKFDLIFSDRISRRLTFDLTGPQTYNYDESVVEFMRAFKGYMGEI